MKKLIAAILLLCFVSNVAMADCDWTQIKKLPDGGFEYTPALNLCVGNLVQDNKTMTAQIDDYKKAITLKDLALTNADARVQMWETTAGNENDRLQKIESDHSQSAWTYFGLGVATTFLAAYAAAQLNHR